MAPELLSVSLFLKLVFGVTLGALVMIGCTTPPEPTPWQQTSPPSGLIIPLYVYPDRSAGAEAAWRLVAETAERHPELQFLVVVNPSNGPGSGRDTNYQRALRLLSHSGVILLGYVAVSYGDRPAADLRRDFRRWRRLYPGVAGLFIDETPVQAEAEPYLRALVAAGRSSGFGPIVANPGIPAPPYFFADTLFDVVVVHEECHAPVGPGAGSDAALATAARSAVLVYGEGVWDEAVFRQNLAHYGWVFFNDHNLDVVQRAEYAWNYLPRNLPRQAELMREQRRANADTDS